MQSVEKPQYVCAVWDYEAIENNELTFKIGDYIEIVNTENDDWWEGILNGFQGFFPANRVKKVSQEEIDIIHESMNSNATNEVASPVIDSNYSYGEGDDEPISPISQNYDNQYSNDGQDFNMSSLVNTQLPENWITEYDENTGKYYYRNIQTNETSWEFPVYNSNIEEFEKDLPIGWKASYADGLVYYYNEYTNETSWEKPKKLDEPEYKKPEPVENFSELPYDNKLQIDLPAKKIRKSSDLSVKYEYTNDKGRVEKGHWKCFVILCGSILLIYKKFTGPLSEQLPIKYINIRNCQVDKSKKKKNVVVIVSSSEETVTLNNNNENDANAWLDIIKKFSIGDDDDDDSDIIDMLDRAYTKAGVKNPYVDGTKESNHNNKNGKNGKARINIFGKVMKSQSNLLNNFLVFGGSLEEQVQKEGSNIPSIVKDCIREIEKRGIDTEGIYRLSGNSSVVNRLKEQYNKGETINFDDDEIDIPVLSSLLKSYFRELQDTLIPSRMYENFLEVLRINDETQRLTQLYDLLNNCLPKENYDVLSYLMKHLKEVSEQSDKNKMAINNLAIVFGYFYDYFIIIYVIVIIMSNIIYIKIY